ESTLSGDVDYSGFLDYEPVLTPAMETATGATQVGNQEIELLLAGRNAEEMRISEDSSFTGIYFEDFSPTKTFILSEGGGLKTIFAQFRSPTGTESSPISIQVNYLTDGPVITDFNLTEGQEIHRPIDIQGQASAALGLSELEFYVDDILLASTTVETLAYRWDIRQTGSGIHRAKLLAMDPAGNISTLERNVVLDLEPPPAPVITEPIDGLTVTEVTITVRGSSEPFVTLTLRRDGFVVGNITPAADGSFEIADIELLEGYNQFIAVAQDNEGQSPTSNAVNVLLDTGAPSAPELLKAEPRPGVGISLAWKYADTGEMPVIFRVYRHTEAFSDPSLATLVAENLIKLSYYDTEVGDGLWYYGIVSVDGAGNVSVLSNLMVATYDSLAPSFNLNFDKVSPVGPGPVNVTLSLSEPLIGTPALTMTPAGTSVPLAITLIQDDELTYSGSF
ncbi:MAG: hypothetical protein P8X92_08910, partial [Dehalococcoidia bacterium]